MNTHYEIPPRLRLNRQASSFAATVDDSHFRNTFNHERNASDDEGDEGGSTPRLGITEVSVDSFDEPLHFSAQAQAQSTPAPAAREATPAERLRAILSRANSITPTVKTQNVPLERTPAVSAALLGSDMESEDFETPRPAANGVPATPHAQLSTTSSVAQSVARDSVRSIFAHAFRSPGDTPGRPRRPRRGSMDSGILEESSIKWSMLKPGERVKRLSLSDDEKERMKATAVMSEKSFTSSQAAAYDQLRQRLERSSRNADSGKVKSYAKSDVSIDMEEATEVEQQLFSDRKAPIRSATPPVPPNTTPGQSASQFPSQFLGSNLLTENSAMRRLIEDVEAQLETTDSEAPQSNHKDNKTPMAGPSTARPSLARERTMSGNSVGSLSSSNSRPTSRQSMVDFSDDGEKRERERGWNHPLGPFMERHRATSPFYTVSHSGGLARMRKPSLSSISGSESDASHWSPKTATARKQNHVTSPASSKYAGISSSRYPSSSPNQMHVSARIRTVSQPSKPSSPGSLVSSANSDKTQKPLERPRTVSLTARDTARPSSGLAKVRSTSGYSRNGIHVDQPNLLASPSSRSLSRSSSQASLRQSEGPEGHEQPHVRERNWNSPRPKWNAMGSPSLMSERRRSGNAVQLRSPTIEHPSRPAPHGTSSSPSSIPRLVVNGRSRTLSRAESGKGKDIDDQKSRSSVPLTTISTNMPINGGNASTKDKNVRHSAVSKLDHKAQAQRELDPRARPPADEPEINGTDGSEEDDTPKLGQQRIPDSPTPVSGSRPGSRVGTSSGFALRSASNGNERANAPAPSVAFMAEKEHHRRDAEQRRDTPPRRVSMPSEHIDLRDSDLDSFQEEDIVASSSAPRLHNGNDSFSESSSQAENSPAGVDVLRPRQDTQLNGHVEDASRKRPILPENFSPPLSAHAAHGDPVTLTPQRRVLANTSKLEFRTPSPPKGMPALPEAPSSDEDGRSDKNRLLPVTPAGRNRLTEMKTPRFPGAWATPFATPAPPAMARVSTLSRDTHAEENQVTVQNEIHTPPASYSRATSVIMKTPAPPGAWLATPGTVTAKRLQQKVRFDEQENLVAPGLVSVDEDSTATSDISAVDGSVVMRTSGKGKLMSPRSPGRFRVVDAFGNEISPSKPGEDRSDKRSDQKTGELHATGKDEKPNPPDGRKARIRVLDAMGRQIDTQAQSGIPLSTADESAKQPSKAGSKAIVASSQGIRETKLERSQALQLLQKTIAELKKDVDETDAPVTTQTTDDIDAQIADLKAQTIRAKGDRERLLRKIRDTTTGVSFRSPGAWWNALIYGKTVASSSTRSTYFRVFAILVFLQAVAFLAFYHLASLGARQLFLTTYIDPFYPELYLPVANPDHLQSSMPPSSGSGMSASPSIWKYLLLVSWHIIRDRILILKESMWDVWRDPPRGIPWPPT